MSRRPAGPLVGVAGHPLEELTALDAPLAADPEPGDLTGLQLALHDLGMEAEQFGHLRDGQELDVGHGATILQSPLEYANLRRPVPAVRFIRNRVML